MYEEFERNVSSGRRAGVGTWILLGLAGFMFMGFAASVVGFFVVRDKVADVVERLEADPALVAAEMLQRLDPELQVVVPAEGTGDLAAVRDRRTGALAAFDFRDLVEGSFRFQEADGSDVRIRLQGDASGGFLDIEADGERVTMDLARTDDGGSLVIRSPDGELHLGAGDEAMTPPDWVPAVAGRPEHPRQIYSARSSEGMLGAVGWESDASPTEVVEAFREALAAQGFSARAEATVRIRSERGGNQATLWAENADGNRHLFVVASYEDGRTAVLLGFGDEG